MNQIGHQKSESDQGTLDVKSQGELLHTESPKSSAKEAIADEGSNQKSVELQKGPESLQHPQGRISSLQNRLLEEGILDKIEGILDKIEDSNSGSDQSKASEKRPTCIPKVHRVERWAFKNKHVAEKQSYAIEVLVGEAKYYYQRTTHLAKKYGKTESTQAKAESSAEPSTAIAELPERFRINSEPVLTIMGQIDSEEAWSHIPTVVRRPYKPFIHFEPQIREKYQRLEEKWAKAEKAMVIDKSAVQDISETSSPFITDAKPTKDLASEKPDKPAEDGPKENVSESLASNSMVGDLETKKPLSQKELEDDDKDRRAVHMTSDDSISKKDDPEVLEPDDPTDSVEALQHLRCLIEFMDDELMPVVSRFHTVSNHKIAFSHLWYVFQPGDILYAPLGSKSEDGVAGAFDRGDKQTNTRRLNDRFHEVWRIQFVSEGRPFLRGKTDEDNNRDGNEKANHFYILAYNVEFIGSIFGARSYLFFIRYFEGLRDITSLSFYPLGYTQNADELKSRWITRGKLFKEFTTFKDRYYTGRSLTCHPNGDRSLDEDLPKHAENIDSQVIVDFSEALAANPGWAAALWSISNLVSQDREFTEDYPTSFWKDVDGKDLDRSETDHIYYDRRIDLKITEEYEKTDGLIKDDPEKSVFENGGFGDEHLILLPNRVFAFALKNRKFGKLYNYLC